ncbi:hypothetical protein GCM10010293_65740 [Streptomyces griseoflavus]|nr:hypothetical protein GCM10010293_65740 [Streptomyces griseoflavus]
MRCAAITAISAPAIAYPAMCVTTSAVTAPATAAPRRRATAHTALADPPSSMDQPMSDGRSAPPAYTTKGSTQPTSTRSTSGGRAPNHPRERATPKTDRLEATAAVSPSQDSTLSRWCWATARIPTTKWLTRYRPVARTMNDWAR